MFKDIEYRCTQEKQDLFLSLLEAGFVEKDGYYLKTVEKPDFLLVAHADTVQPDKTAFFIRTENYLFSPLLDDRLGVALAVDILPSLIHCDILITDNEEIGMSTAQDFIPTADYSCIIELDRGGEDVVTYDIDSEIFLTSLKTAGFEVGWGSYSDICDIETGLCCMNLGIGYHSYHSQTAYCDIRELERNLDRLMNWIEVNKDFRWDSDPYFHTSLAVDKYDDFKYNGKFWDDVWNDGEWNPDDWSYQSDKLKMLEEADICDSNNTGNTFTSDDNCELVLIDEEDEIEMVN